MNLRRGSRSQRVLTIDGWDLPNTEWDLKIALGSLRPNDPYPAGTDYAAKKRALLCSDKDRIADQYRLIRMMGSSYIVESEQENAWRGNQAYQYFYQLRIAGYTADLYKNVTTPKASGLPGQPVRTLQSSSACDIEAAGALESPEIEDASYSRVKLHFPGNVTIDIDTEVEINSVTYNVLSVLPFSKMLTAVALRHGVSS